MDVHIDVGGCDLEIEEVWHLHALRHKTVVGGEDGLMEIGVLHITAVHEEIVVAALLPGSLGFADEAGDRTHGGMHLHRQEILAVLTAKHIADALAQTACLEVHHLRAVMMEGEVDGGIHECDPLEGGQDITEFGGVGLQELPTRGNVEEEILDLEVTTHGTGDGFL